jgi:predicted nucleotidyltransferase
LKPPLAVRLFGSSARGDNDARSDADVLVVYREKPSEYQRAALLEELRSSIGGAVDVASYSGKRISSFFESGDLFAWHLYQESIPINASIPDFVTELGTPSRYLTGRDDVSNFTSLLTSVPQQLALCPQNYVYEAGLLYLTTRNIAMSASGSMDHEINFTRLAAIKVSLGLGLDFPIPLVHYKQLITCRHASQRGGIAPKIEVESLIGYAEKSLVWAEKILQMLPVASVGNKNE